MKVNIRLVVLSLLLNYCLACNSGIDCNDSDCCLSNTRPIGKRSDPGRCSALGINGSSCIVKYGSGKPMDMVFECPCVSGLTCHGTGKYDVPLGEIGICGP